MARNIITTQTIFFLLVVFVLCIFFYNVVHFTIGLKSNKCEERIRGQKEEIARLKREIADLSEGPPCIVPSSSESDFDETEGNGTGTNQPRPTSLPTTSYNPLTPILVIACNRDDYLKTTLTHLFKYRPKENFPVFVSQGCDSPEVANLLQNEYGDSVVALQHHKKQGAPGYFAIAQHYGWALTQIFSVMNFESVIIVEDDLQISSDFFEYFIALAPILRSDPSLYCVSSWNDNGMSENVRDPKAVYRTDVFPGLGWMMTRSLWNEIKDQWPDRYWDEYMRLPQIRKNRSCLFPEISRNKNIGQRGTSEQQFWDKISRIKFNEEHVNFTKMDMSYLMKDRYEVDLKKKLERAKMIQWTEADKYENEDLRIEYDNINHFRSVAQFFRIMDDEKEGNPRTSYKGVVTFRHNSNKIFLTPANLNDRW